MILKAKDQGVAIENDASVICAHEVGQDHRLLVESTGDLLGHSEVASASELLYYWCAFGHRAFFDCVRAPFSGCYFMHLWLKCMLP